MATLRQLSFGMLDMGWHGQDPTAIDNLKRFEKINLNQHSFIRMLLIMR